MIALTKDGSFWQITLERPDRANALTADMLEALIEAVSQAHSDAQALVITGTGRTFSAGADLDEARTGLATSPLWERLSAAIARLPCLSIAALNGTLAGGAFGMALACDLRLAVPEARLFYPVMKLGFLPQPSDPGRLVALVGPARARMILLAGQPVSAPVALEWGLIDRLADPGDLIAESRALAEAALAAPRAHLAAVKRMIPWPVQTPWPGAP